MIAVIENQNLAEENLIKEFHRGDIQSIAKFLINDANSILEIGCGIGDYIVNTNPTQKVYAIEPHLPYLETARKRAPWVEYFNTDALSFFKKNEMKYDLILMIDVVEHLKKEDAIVLMNYARHNCANIIFSQIPYGIHEQHHDEWNMGGEYWQTHRSTWDEYTIQELRFSFYEHIEDFYPGNREEENKTESTILGFWINKFNELGKKELTKKYLNNLKNKNYKRWQQAYKDGYSSTMGDHRNYFYDYFLQEIHLYEAIDNSKKIVEYAPGDGLFINRFVQQNPLKEFHLIDISEKNLGDLNSRFINNPNVYTYLNYPEKKDLVNIDVVFSFLLCQSMPRSIWTLHLKAVLNMLSKGGSYFFQFAYKENESSNDSVETAISGSNKYEVNEIAEMLEKIGFSGCDFTIPITLEALKSDVIWYVCRAIK